MILYREFVTLRGDGLNCVVQVEEDEHGLRLTIGGVNKEDLGMRATVRGPVCAEAVGDAVGRAVAFMYQAERRDEATTEATR